MKYNGIVISGSPGSGKSTLARKLGDLYGVPIFSIGQLFRDRWKKEYPNEEVAFDEYWKGLDLCVNREIDSQARDFLEENRAIGDFRFARKIAPNNYLRVGVYCSVETRALRLIRNPEYPIRHLLEIEKNLVKREQDEIDAGKKLYGAEYDYTRRDEFSIILNSDFLTIEQEVDLVKSLIKKL